MSKGRMLQPSDESQMKDTSSRRAFVRSSVVVAAFASKDLFAAAGRRPYPDEESPVRLGVASYTFRKRRRLRWRTMPRRGSSFTLPERFISRKMKMRTSGASLNTASERELG